MSPSKGFLDALRQVVQNEGMAVADKLADHGAHRGASSGLATQSRWRNAGIETSGMTVLEHVRASEVCSFSLFMVFISEVILDPFDYGIHQICVMPWSSITAQPQLCSFCSLSPVIT
jgi:hypothetical protein